MSFSRTRWNLVALAAVTSAAVFCLSTMARAAVTITVTTQSDVTNPNDGKCSLREAVVAANTNTASGSVAGECSAGSPSGTTISLPDGTYVLSGTELQISAPVTIIGTANHPTVYGSNSSRVFSIAGGVNATITGVEIAGGFSANGGGILNNGTLTLTDDSIDNNATAVGATFGVGALPGGPGGGLDNEGTATLTRVTVNFNHTGAGGTGSTSGNSGGAGGGIYNAGTLTLTDSHVTDNQTGAGGYGGTASLDGGAGGGIFNAGTLTVTGGEISHNTTGNGGGDGSGVVGGAGGSGGGLEAHGTVSISGTSIASNRSGDGGLGSTVGGLGGAGGGVDASTYRANGGGFASLDSLTMSKVTLAANTRGQDHATQFPGTGGAAVNILATNSASVTISGSAITGTNGGSGIAVVAQRINTVGTGAVQLGLRNTTITGGSAAGISVATTSDNPSVQASLTGQITYATIAGNAGAAIANAGGSGQPTGPSLTTQNSIAAANAACTGTITAAGQNLSFGNAGCPGTNADPKLGPLGNHGGPTPTIPLLAGSPAIDAVPAADAACTGTDQRGVTRPTGSGCDIGSYEVAPPKLAAATATATGTSSATVSAGVTPGDGDTSITVRYGPTTSYGSQAAGSTLPAGTTSAPVSVPLTGLAPGTAYHAQLVATSAEGTTTSGDLAFTTTASSPPPPPGGGSSAAPRLSALAITPASFTAASRGPSIARTATGAMITYRDTLAATTTFTVTLLRRGHRTKSGTCSTAPIRRGQRLGRPCTKAAPVGQFRHIDAAGANSFRFTGRLNGRTLVAGSYALSAVARLAGKTGTPVEQRFTIRV